MAVTISLDELAADLRIGNTTEERELAGRRLAYATVEVLQYAPLAPDLVHNEAVSRLAGFLYDQPTLSGGLGYANAMRSCGAQRMLFAYRIHGGGLIGGEAVQTAQGAIGTVGNPVTDVDIVGDELVITFADGSTETHALPAGGGGGGSGATAAEIMALIANHAAMPEIHHIQGGSSLIVGNIIDGRLPGTPIAMRMGWGETNPPVANVFTRDNNHPYDGVAVGTSELTYMPPFPPALIGEHTLFVFIWLEGSPVDAAIWVNPGLDNQGDFTGFFTDGVPLEVEGVAGTVYVSLFQFSLNESQGYASPQPGPLLATQTWVTAQIANIMLSGGGITTAQAQTLIDAAIGAFQTAAEVQAVVTAAIAALPDYQTLQEVNALITAAVDALSLGQTAVQVQALIDAHAAMSNIHHAPGGGAGPPAGWHWLSQVTGAFVANTTRDMATVATFPLGPYADYTALVAAVADGSMPQVAIRLSQTDPGGSDDDGAVFIIPNVLGFHFAAGQFRAFPAWNLGVDPVKFDIAFGPTSVTAMADVAIPAAPLLIVRVGVWG